MDDQQQGFDWREAIGIAIVLDAIIGGIGWIIWPWMVHTKPAVAALLTQYGPWILGYIGVQAMWTALGGGFIGY